MHCIPQVQSNAPTYVSALTNHHQGVQGLHVLNIHTFIYIYLYKSRY